MAYSNNVLEIDHRPIARPATSLREGWVVLTALILATLAVTVDNTVLNVALPSISADLHASTSELQWIVNAYGLVFGSLLLTGGSLADRIGRRRVLLAGLLAFSATSALVLLVHTATELIVLRALSGAAAAFLMPSTVALMYRTFEGSARATAIGIAGAIAGLGFVVGPLIGGVLLEFFAWQSVFLINVPIAILAIFLTRAAVPGDVERSGGRADLTGTALSVFSMSALVAVLIDGPDHGWTSALVVAFGLAALAGAATFVWWELRAAHPMIHIPTVARKPVLGPGAAQAGLMFAISGSLFLITQQLQVLHGYSPLQAGLRTAPIAVGLVCAGPVLSWSVKAFGPPTAAAIGLVLTAAALLLMALGVDDGYWPLAIGLFVIGVGARVTITVAALAVLDGLPNEEAGIGAGLGDTFQEIGGAVGVALVGSIFNAVYRSQLPASSPAAARSSLQAALDLHDGSVAAAARHAFASGAQIALLVCAAVVLLLAVVARRSIPRGLDITDA